MTNQLTNQSQIQTAPGIVTRAVNSTSKSLRVSPTMTKMMFGGATLGICCLVTWQLTRKGKRAKWPKWVRLGLGVALASIVGTALRGVDTLSEAPVIVQQPKTQQQIANDAQNRLQNRNQIAAQRQQALSLPRTPTVNGAALFQRPQADARFAGIELGTN